MAGCCSACLPVTAGVLHHRRALPRLATSQRAQAPPAMQPRLFQERTANAQRGAGSSRSVTTAAAPGSGSSLASSQEQQQQQQIATPPHSSDNGSGNGDASSSRDGAREAAAAAANAGLRAEMDSLRQLLEQQGQLISQQADTIQALEQKLLQARPLAEQGLLGSTPSPLPELQAAAPPLPGALPMAEPKLEGLAISDRRVLGCYDARYHSTHSGATPRDYRLLPRRIVLVRHAQSEGNVDNFQYTYVPDPKVPLTAKGWEQALDAGEKLKSIVEADGKPYRLFFYTSPYLRSKQTYEGLIQAFEPHQLIGVQEEVQLREQDFGNFQDAEGKKQEKAERLRFGRFFYRFPNGESGADVYDRMTIFEDHLVRDINAGRYGYDSTLVLVTHGLAARIFLMRWFHWTVDQFMNVFNIPNAVPVVLERITNEMESRPGGPASWIHTKALYRLTEDSMDHLVGCTEEMCSTSWMPRGIESTPR